MKLYVELRDDSDNLLYYLHKQIRRSSLYWVWSRIGGCRSCGFTLKEDFDSDIVNKLKPNYRIYIKIDGVSWWSGYIDKIAPQITGNREEVEVFVLGFANLLKHIVVQDLSYSSQEISVIAKNVIDNQVVPKSPITSTAGDYEETDFTPDQLDFNTTAYDAIRTLSDIVGNREWGVRADKSFFFKERDNEIKHFWFLDEDIANFNKKIDYNSIVTRVILEGGTVADERYTPPPFDLIGAGFVREKRLTYGSITTQSVAQRLARMYLKKHGLAKHNYTVVRNINNRLEETIPIGRVAVNRRLGIKTKYDSGAKYDSGIKYDGGTENFQLDSITYKPIGNILQATVNVGIAHADLVGEMGKLEFLIDQVKNY